MLVGISPHLGSSLSAEETLQTRRVDAQKRFLQKFAWTELLAQAEDILRRRPVETLVVRDLNQSVDEIHELVFSNSTIYQHVRKALAMAEFTQSKEYNFQTRFSKESNTSSAYCQFPKITTMVAAAICHELGHCIVDNHFGVVGYSTWHVIRSEMFAFLMQDIALRNFYSNQDVNNFNENMCQIAARCARNELINIARQSEEHIQRHPTSKLYVGYQLLYLFCWVELCGADSTSLREACLAYRLKELSSIIFAKVEKFSKML